MILESIWREDFEQFLYQIGRNLRNIERRQEKKSIRIDKIDYKINIW